MPIFYYKCEPCNEQVSILKKTASNALICDYCGLLMKRNAKGPSTQVMDSLDNGAMPRKIVRLRDAERLYSERNRKADPMAGRSLKNTEDLVKEKHKDD